MSDAKRRNALGLLGRKVGMTRIFTDDGETVPVTVLDVSGNRVTQVKTVETDGYNAVQVAFGKQKPARVAKPLAGHYAKAGVEAGTVLREFPVDAAKLAELKPGATLSADLFHPALRFFSFEHGFSKPDPHVFQLLTARLGALGIAPEETLMVGDRLDNDIVPARAFGWQTWRVQTAPAADAGDFGALCAALELD